MKISKNCRPKRPSKYEIELLKKRNEKLLDYFFSKPVSEKTEINLPEEKD